ncbi:lanC-like protein 2 [Ischnura elegans]|uniref:lanC-like protein 2 n=1 Tax=Ischnura elegans TaxID=197161 RepID=UPI001ED8757D|nr:lanC-like protein 2 [Ischnura elegans]
MVDERSYPNPFEDYVEERFSEFFELTKAGGFPKLKSDFKERLRTSVDQLLARLEAGMATTSRSDVSMYTGTPGYALLFWMLSRKRPGEDFQQHSMNILEAALPRLRNRDVTFICGDPGPLALAAVVYHTLGKPDRSVELVKRIKSFAPIITDLESDLPDEALYGRVGYLYSLLFLNHYLRPNAIEDNIIRQVLSAILASGKSLAKSEHRKVPLMYRWHGSYYFGAAHGIAGILYTLLLARDQLTDSELMELIRPTIDFLLDTSFPSGNLPSSLGREKDKLVHWCHGAPGAVYLYCLAYKVFHDERYLDAAKKCGEVVWQRGLLRKGYGICHGVAGNAYTFLCLLQTINDCKGASDSESQQQSWEAKYLYRACKFAEWCMTYDERQDRVPDRPFSLFEGLAGTIYFMNDMQDPMEARFPAFAL